MYEHSLATATTSSTNTNDNEDSCIAPAIVQAVTKQTMRKTINEAEVVTIEELIFDQVDIV